MQFDFSMCFDGVEINRELALSFRRRLSDHRFAPGNKVHENHDDSDDQQNVDESAHGVTADQAQKP